MFMGAKGINFINAKKHRTSPTEAESVLWNYLAKNQLGVKFRRQHPIANFIADFYCHAARLIIEVDGSIHNNSEQILYDQERDRELLFNGIRTIRFTNNQVIKQTEKVIEKIKEHIAIANSPFRGQGGLAKRIIPCLDVKDGRTVKGINFVELRDAGDPVELAIQYSEQGADELVFLDITATHEKRKTLAELVKNIARNINIPFTIGGGINELADADLLLNAGADKVSVNSAAVRNPQLINEFADSFGSQFIVVAVDTKRLNNGHIVHLNGGRLPTELQTQNWIKEVQDRGAGEILLTSMDHDGTKNGFDCELLGEINQWLTIPLIASGGAGNMEHFAEVFNKTNVDAALAASVFHYGEILIPDLKAELKKQGIVVR
ncbi:imidazole glycerol phosphate synthase subunit HisF [Solitalea longa]|uniref:Imidazole glycerol phosphate synthase subunit HisF n=1 Tax=Solitalea longa TaxID=2079460 RepID=A0A2S5A698_9SPHI|nr:imidazole glycerol phosphate synthase subunit HisF [Solitalea longa]